MLQREEMLLCLWGEVGQQQHTESDCCSEGINPAALLAGLTKGVCKTALYFFPLINVYTGL